MAVAVVVVWCWWRFGVLVAFALGVVLFGAVSSLFPMVSFRDIAFLMTLKLRGVRS